MMSVKPRRRATPVTERVAQKRRTRKAIVDAAIGLLARGGRPSVSEVAAAADVSRRTVFLHFPTFDHLLLDATAGALSESGVGRAVADGPPGEGGAARVERMVRAMQRVTPEIERLGRALVRLTVDVNAPQRRDGLPRRGYRRMEWIESALAPLRDRLDPAAWRRLACALAMVVGWESLIVQRDVCALSVEEGEELSVWVARALVTTALAEARQHQRAVRARPPG